MPFIEIPHTADWCLRVWAEDLPLLFSEAALGMNSLAGIKLATQPIQEQVFQATAPDIESLLVSFLSNLVYLIENERIGFYQFSFHMGPTDLTAKMKGAPVISENKTIKAVTFHNLKVKKNSSGYEVEIVFDV